MPARSMVEDKAERRSCKNTQAGALRAKTCDAGLSGKRCLANR